MKARASLTLKRNTWDLEDVDNPSSIIREVVLRTCFFIRLYLLAGYGEGKQRVHQTKAITSQAQSIGAG